MPKLTSDPGAFQLEMLKPKFLGTWILLAVIWLIQWLPRRWVMGIGAWVGDQMRLRNRKRRHIAEVNIRLCFPELSEDDRESMLVSHFRQYGRGLVDMGLIMTASVERVENHSMVIGRENLEGHSRDQRLILIGYHTTTLDMCSSSMFGNIDVVSMMKRDKNPVLNRFLYRARTRHRRADILMRDNGLRNLLKGLLEGKLCYLVPDEDFGDQKNTVFAPFFKQPRSMLNTVSRLAGKTGALVIPAICRLNPKTGLYTTEVSSPLENFPTGDDVEDAARINAAMEQLIRKAPDQYLWTFRWFRSQPGGLSNPYEASSTE